MTDVLITASDLAELTQEGTVRCHRHAQSRCLRGRSSARRGQRA